MATDKDVIKKAMEDWKKAFPQLTPYAPKKLYRVAGPVIIGIELVKLLMQRNTGHILCCIPYVVIIQEMI